MRKTDYPDLEFASSWRAFIEQRAALLAILEPLSAEGWARTAIVKVYGEPFEYSVQYYGNKLARHEAVQIPQIESIVKSLTS
jgi:hypothetical protein